MKPEEQRIAIAEACGWKQHPQEPCVMLHKEHSWRLILDLPDYLNDLNAMHEAEETLRKNQFHFVDYYGTLFMVVSCLETYEGNIGYFEFELVTATASQRAEAFLKTIGKWKE
jgi:hypothetical protein